MTLIKKIALLLLFFIAVTSCSNDETTTQEEPIGDEKPDPDPDPNPGPDPDPVPVIIIGSAKICEAKGSGKLYEVGPGKEYEKIIDVPTENLGPGDAVKIYAKSEPYFERIIITTKGAEQAPICICGVPDTSGKLPILDGTNARVRPSTSKTPYAGVIVVGNNFNNHPEYINISNLQLQGAHQYKEDDTQRSYEMDTDNLIPYSRAAAGISLRGAHFEVANCIIRHNGNGIFGAYNGPDNPLIDVTLKNNIITDNGTFDVDRQHNIYLESNGLVSVGNRFGPIRDGSRGVNYKSRSAGDIIMYNHFIGPAGRQINLPESENSVDHFPQLDSFQKTYVAGNIIEGSADGATSILHYGNDINSANPEDKGNRRGDLYAYNNTFILKGDAPTSFRKLFFDITFCEGRLHAFNNILQYENNSNEGDSEISILRDRGSVINFSNNLVTSATRAAYVTRIPSNEQLNICSPNTLLYEPTIQDMMVSNSDMALDSNNMYRLTNSSKAINTGITIPENVPKLEYQFKSPNGVEPRQIKGSAIDIGAFEL